MGAAVCYKPRPYSISKEDILRALNEKHYKETVTEPPEHSKTEEHVNLVSFCNFTSNFNIITHELQQSSPVKQSLGNQKLLQLNQKEEMSSHLDLNILSYFGTKDQIFHYLPQLSRSSLYFIKKKRTMIEQNPLMIHANQRIKLLYSKSIEDHSSGINQMIKLATKQLVTVSDDCSLKFWHSATLKVEATLLIETITCIAVTGFGKQDILVAGCHSGNLVVVSASQKQKKEQINNAHYNLIRVIVSLKTLKDRYFVTADVCGFVKVWHSFLKPNEIMEIKQDGAISYNSMVEVSDYLPKRDTYDEAALIAVALKSCKVNLILLLPGQGTYQLLKTFKTTLKPTCLIQLSCKHLAIAVGSLREPSQVEIHDMNQELVVQRLNKHQDMIDSLLKLEFSSSKSKSENQFVTWLLSASRDRQIILWKLIDGKVMKKYHEPIIKTISPLKEAEKNKSPNSSKLQKEEEKIQKKKRRVPSGEDEQEEQGEEESILEEEKQESEQINEMRTSQTKVTTPDNGLQDYFFVLETNHKDFIRSMVQPSENVLLTASEDKTIKMFNISF